MSLEANEKAPWLVPFWVSFQSSEQALNDLEEKHQSNISEPSEFSCP